MEIAQLLKTFKTAKIILGNGFDLFCGVKTKYCHFFESELGYYEDIKKWYFEFTGNNVNQYLDSRIVNNDSFKPAISLDNKITVWDIFFHLVSMDNNYNVNWCDIEEAMLLSFGKGMEVQSRYPVIWDNVLKLFSTVNNKIYDYTHAEKLCCAFIKSKGISFIRSDKVKFYEYLLQELKKFEKRFGLYISKQTQTPEYKKNFELTINKLVNKNTTYSIDTFNYTSIKNVRNINGNVKNPIFGIDSSLIKPTDPIYIFTKIYRRLEFDISVKNYDADTISKNIIIFGHSLNKQDYNYFFPLFNRLKINTNEFNGCIVFAYNIYDKKMKDQIKSNLILNISKMFTSYEMYYNKSNEEYRLMEILHSGGRIIFYEINNDGLI